MIILIKKLYFIKVYKRKHMFCCYGYPDTLITQRVDLFDVLEATVYANKFTKLSNRFN